jgi:hypothetical protein
MNDPHTVEGPTFIYNRYSRKMDYASSPVQRNQAGPAAILLVQDSRSRGHTLHLASVPPLHKTADHLGKSGSRNIIIAQVPFVCMPAA